MKMETRILAVLSGAFPEADKEYMEQLSTKLVDLFFTEHVQVMGAIQVLEATLYTPPDDKGRKKEVIDMELVYYMERLFEVADDIR